MIKIRFLILMMILLFCENSMAKYSLRRCMLLPISDSMNGALSFKVFEETEKYIKEGSWCYYKNNSEIINVLGHYKENLKTHLNNSEVIKVIADKTKAGSLIKIDLVGQVNGIEIEIKILGENGEDVYFKEKSVLQTDDINVIARTIQNWLEIYSKSIPYDARVIGVMGDQFTIDIGREFGILPGNKITLYRPLRKKQHPLLKEIVEWEKTTMADGEIFHISDFQSQGKVQTYRMKKQLKVGDWAIIEKENPKDVDKNLSFEIKDEQSFGKLGTLAIFLNLGTGSTTATLSSTDVRKIGGFLFGVDFVGELFITREYWTSLSIGQRFGSYTKEEGNLSTTASNSVSNNALKWKMGYKYLPIGFFNGPQIDGYMGYATFKYGLDSQTSDGIVESNFSGLLLGVKGSMPLVRGFKLNLELEFLLTSSYEEDSYVFGEDDSSSYYGIKLGGQYNFSPNINFDFNYSISANKANFVSPEREVAHKESILGLGTSFSF